VPFHYAHIYLYVLPAPKRTKSPNTPDVFCRMFCNTLRVPEAFTAPIPLAFGRSSTPILLFHVRRSNVLHPDYIPGPQLKLGAAALPEATNPPWLRRKSWGCCSCGGVAWGGFFRFFIARIVAEVQIIV